MMLLQTKPCKRVTPEKKGEPPPASPVSGGQWAEARPEAVSPWCAFVMETCLRLRQHARGVQSHLRF